MALQGNLPNSDTIVAIATPHGEGALGIVRISGPEAISIVSSLVSLKDAQPISALPAQKSSLAIFHLNGTKIDRVLVTLFRAPRSYTGEDLIEISAHGSPAVLKRIVQLLIERGARVAEPGEFSQRAFLNGKMDLSQAEAVADLIRAQTEFSRAVAFSQLEGALTQELKKIKEEMIEILAHIEVEIDHSDDATVGKTMEPPAMQAKLTAAKEKIEQLIQSYEFGKIAKEGVKIAIIGKPNVGKSSLLNALLKEERAIVTAVAGTTRDTIEERFDLLGIPAVVIDTAGIRKIAADLPEQLGIKRTKSSLQNADLAIVVLDGSEKISEEDQEVLELAKTKQAVVLAVNKSDLEQKIELAKIQKKFPNFPVVSISALKNTGIELLLQTLYQKIVPHQEKFSQQNRQVWVTSLRHKNCLERAQERLESALQLFGDPPHLLDCSPVQMLANKCGGEQPSIECAAEDLREVLDALGEIVGEVCTEDLLKEVFSRFCVGK